LDVARFVVKRFKTKINMGSADWFAYFLLDLNIKAFFCVLKQTGYRFGFWYYVPRCLWRKKLHVRGGLLKLIKPILKPFINLLYVVNGHKDFSNKFFKKLHIKVNE